jgi:hypothetical protein
MTITLDEKARGSLRKFGGKPGQKFTARTEGECIVLEPVEAEVDSGENWKPTMSLAELYRDRGSLPENFGVQMNPEKVRGVNL